MSRLRGICEIWENLFGYSRAPCSTFLLFITVWGMSGGDCRSDEPRFRPRLPKWLKLTQIPARPSRASLNTDRFESGAANARRETPSKRTGPLTMSAATVPPIPPVIIPVTASSQDEGSATVKLISVDDTNTHSMMIPPALDEGEFTLEALIALADAHHPRLTAAYQRVQAADGRAVQAGLYPNPKVAVSSPQVAGKESQYNGFASQEIVTAGKLKLSVAAAQREIDQAQFAWKQDRFAVVTDLRQKFYATLAAQQRAIILTKLVQIAVRSKETAQRLFEAGESARGDVLLLDIELRRAEVALKNANTIYEIGRRQLALLIAVPELTIDSLSGDLEAVTRDYDLEEVRLAVAAVNPQANIARLEIDRIAYLLRRAQVEPIPNVDLMAGYQRQIGIPAMDQGLFQVTMAIPLWNKNQGNISAAQAELSGAHADLQRVELELANLAADAVATYQTASQLVTQYETEILPKAQETLQLTQDLYAQGEIDFLRLLQSQKTLLDAELARIDAQEQRWVSASALAGLLLDEVFP